MENQNKQRGVERELKELVQKYNVLEKGQIYAILKRMEEKGLWGGH